MTRWTKVSWSQLALLLLTATLVVAGVQATVQAADTPGEQGNFSLLVTPSPLVTTLKPGSSTDLELKIRNGSTTVEELKMDTRSFKLNNRTGQVQLSNVAPSEIGQWITFANPIFKVQPGEWFTQKIHIALPKDTGFSYSFALMISRKNNPPAVAGTRALQGSVAVFTLINVDRPGATRKLEIPKFKTTRGFYEYLPATVQITFKNTGNSIVQPSGNVFIQRSGKDKNAISTLPVNDAKGYILPGSDRQLNTEWKSGFPAYVSTNNTNDTGKQTKLKWDWKQVSQLRFGRYTAKLVAIYDDGTRDVPIQQEVNFWVIPWKILIGLFVASLLLLYGAWSIIRKIFRIGGSFKNRGKRKDAKAAKSQTDEKV